MTFDKEELTTIEEALREYASINLDDPTIQSDVEKLLDKVVEVV